MMQKGKYVMNARKIALGIAACASALAAVPALADVKAGVDAWSRGDYTRAVSEWEGPAAQGDADAQFNLAQAYRLGRGVEADVRRARGLYQQAADQGHLKAADNYGLLLFQQGARSDAMPYIRDAAGRGDPRAQYVLGLAHFNADQAEKDWVRAYALLTLANSAGLPQAAGAISQMDSYIPFEQRQEAQVLARRIKQETDARRASQLASIALEDRQPASAPSAGRVPGRIGTAPVAASSASAPAAPAVTAPAVAASAPAARAPAARSGPWKVQLGAFGVRSNADRLWNKLSGTSALSGSKKVLVPSGRITRLLAGGFATRADANRACSRLKASGQDCLVTK
jgi:cell division septation protein DedD